MSSNAPEETTDAKSPAHTLPSGRAFPRRLTWALTVLAFTAIAAVAIYAVSLIRVATLLLLSALLACFIYPLTEFLRRPLKRPLAITAAYLLVKGTLAGLFNSVINLIIVITLSVYFILDGPRIVGWLSHKTKTPANQRNTINFLLHTLDASLGGYFRGTALIALVGAVCTGAALALLRVPYAALPQGWAVTLVVAVFMAPRIFSKTVGVHPIIALLVLFAGAELFVLLGGLLATPVAGVLADGRGPLEEVAKPASRSISQEGSPAQQAALLPAEQVTPGDAPVPGASSRQ